MKRFAIILAWYALALPCSAADLTMTVDTALAEVPVNKVPLVSDSDFKSIQGAVAWDAAGMALRWHFVTTAGAYTVTSVTPTTAGAHDWTDQGDSGVYTIEIPASAGTINNDTEGFGWFTGVATGILPWTGPTIAFVPANIANSDVNGSDLREVDVTFVAGGAATTAGTIDANVVQVGGSTTPVTNLGVVFNTDFAANYDATLDRWNADMESIDDDATAASGTVTFPNATLASTTNITGGTITTTTNLTNLPTIPTDWITANGIAADAIDNSAIATDAIANAEISASAIGDAELAVSGSEFTAIPWNAAWDAEVESEVDDSLGSGTGTALSAVPWNANWDAEVQSEVADALAAATSEVTGVPSGTASMADMVRIMYQQQIYGGTVTATKKTYFDSGGSGEYEQDLSDNGTTYTESSANAP